MTPDAILIVGGGAGGALVAANLLLESPDLRVILIEPRAELGRGMAYSTTCAAHLLNVPAAKMSAFPHQPRHLLNWLEAHYPGRFHEDSFVPRMIYGDYIASVLDQARSSAPGRFEHVRAQAVDFHETPHGVRVRLSDGGERRGCALVLATGNAEPAPWPGLPQGLQSSGRYFPIAWTPGALESSPDLVGRSVLLLGGGLTSVDAILALRQDGFHGQIWMTSRRGLLPQGHQLSPSSPQSCHSPARLSVLTRDMREAAGDGQRLHGNWRPAVDAVRPCMNDLWRALEPAEQRRFLRHLRPFWDIHRHRMAPENAAAIQREIVSGGVRSIAGRIRSIDAAPASLTVTLQRRDGRTERLTGIGRIVNCTGPESNPARLPNPFVRSLIQGGYLAPHPLRTGVWVDQRGAFVTPAGSSKTLFTLGPLRLGTLIETVAMPEIRDQARELALTLAALHAPSQRAPESLPVAI